MPINLTIDGLRVSGEAGDTVLKVCQRNGIDVPTLCHLDAVTDVGACRLCVVEIDGERRVVPSCTYPAREGLVVRTKTDKVEKYRRRTLELLFAERNHFCMFCEQSGDCELQALAYRYQIDHLRYANAYPRLPVDTLSEFMVIDHNRCVLCGRCIRACGDIAAAHTLDFAGRGYKTTVSADIDRPLGESTCTQCGACFQACPTGAIMSKLSMYKGRSADCAKVASACPSCSIGCEISVLVKDNNIVRIEAPDMAAATGALCRKGRFSLLRNDRARITSPQVRSQKGALEACTLDEALSVVARKMKELDSGFAGLVSSRATSETMAAFQRVFGERADTLDGEQHRLTGANGYNSRPLADILKADCILAVGSAIEEDYPVAGSLIRKAVHNNGARLITIDAAKDAFPLWSEIWLKPATGAEGQLLASLARLMDDSTNDPKATSLMRKTGLPAASLKAAAKALREARNAIVVAAASAAIDAAASGSLASANLGMVLLKPAINSQGSWSLGLAKTGISRPNGLYLLATDDEIDDATIARAKGAGFLIVQASYASPLTDAADVVLPSRIWAERVGTYVTTDGRTVQSREAVKPPVPIPQDHEILDRLQKLAGGAK